MPGANLRICAGHIMLIRLGPPHHPKRFHEQAPILDRGKLVVNSAHEGLLPSTLLDIALGVVEAALSLIAILRSLLTSIALLRLRMSRRWLLRLPVSLVAGLAVTLLALLALLGRLSREGSVVSDGPVCWATTASVDGLVVGMLLAVAALSGLLSLALNRATLLNTTAVEVWLLVVLALKVFVSVFVGLVGITVVLLNAVVLVGLVATTAEGALDVLAEAMGLVRDSLGSWNVDHFERFMKKRCSFTSDLISDSNEMIVLDEMNNKDELSSDYLATSKVFTVYISNALPTAAVNVTFILL